LTPTKKETFLTELADGQSVTAASKAIGLSRQAMYKQRDNDEVLAQAWDDAVESGTDELEDVLIQRAKDGDTTALIFALKGRRPEKWKDRVSTEHSGSLAIRHEDALAQLK
jgi:hypothetical protein